MPLYYITVGLSPNDKVSACNFFWPGPKVVTIFDNQCIKFQGAKHYYSMAIHLQTVLYFGTILETQEMKKIKVLERKAENL